MIRKSLGAVAAAMLLLVAPLSIQVASAHPATDFYAVHHRWPVNALAPWIIDNNVPSTWHDAIKAGVARWDNGAGGNGPDFVYEGVHTATFSLNACQGSRTRVFAQEDLGAATGGPSESLAGTVRTCVVDLPSGSKISRTMMALERTIEGGSAGWHAGEDGPPANKWDLRSIVSHETGHLTGWRGHFTGSTLCPDPPTAADTQTMCVGSPSGKGKAMVRTLEPHDLHTYAAAY